MRLFRLDGYNVVVADEAFTLLPFKKILDRDTSENKEIAFKELALVYHFCDLKSNFIVITDESERIESIKPIVGLPKKWKMDSVIKDAISYYNERSITPTMRLYLNTTKSALDASDYLSDSRTLLEERDMKGGIVTSPATLATSLKSINSVLKELALLEKEVIKEQTDLLEKTKGSRTLSMFEDSTDIMGDYE